MKNNYFEDNSEVVVLDSIDNNILHIYDVCGVYDVCDDDHHNNKDHSKVCKKVYNKAGNN
jgi:hypothetical protein